MRGNSHLKLKKPFILVITLEIVVWTFENIVLTEVKTPLNLSTIAPLTPSKMLLNHDFAPL